MEILSSTCKLAVLNGRYLQLIATEHQLQISPAKTKYLASSYFSDTDKRIQS